MRDFLLHDMKRVDYCLARDFLEVGNLVHSDLFDMKWNPKLRLTGYAMSVDVMKDRQLVGMAKPAPGMEAYAVKFKAGRGQSKPAHSIVPW